jgi:16S rRNA processing protein RimM
MAYQGNILLGQITKTSGFEGAVSIKLEKSFIENIPEMESVFLEIEGRTVPFFISESEYPGSDILKLTFEGYESIEKVNEFKGCRVFLTSQTPINQKDTDIQQIAGYSVYDSNNILIGTVTEIIANTGQWLLTILSPEKKKILLPLHEDLIVKIDNKRKRMVMEVPEGLLDLN